MPSHMGVQRFATERNAQTEILVDFIFRKFIQHLHEQGLIKDAAITNRQVPFKRDDCSDVFDHHMELVLAQPINSLDGTVHIWAQTTCYKGNATNTPESNKTYEIRETLVEALGLRRWLTEDGIAFRTIHLTIGPANYTYGWFKLAKDNAFDLSIYPSSTVNTEQAFAELSKLFAGATVEADLYARLESNLSSATSPITVLVNDLLDQLKNWFLAGMPNSAVANQQVALLSKLRTERFAAAQSTVAASPKAGANIKGRAVEVMLGAATTDAALANTVAKLESRNPFLPAAKEALQDWAAWSATHFHIPPSVSTLEGYVRHLWELTEAARLIGRRLLLRIHTDENVPYVQDTAIPGLTEHNLYGGTHSSQQVQEIAKHITANCIAAGISTSAELYGRLVSPVGRKLLAASRRFEVYNGTEVRPSFIYVVEALSADYDLRPFSGTSLPRPIGYHSSFGTINVSSYQNMQVVKSKALKCPVAILKAKYFSQAEFPRRAKEESFVGITTKYEYVKGAFQERYPGLPLIMFVDMDADFTPPSYALVRLVTAGWEVFFSVDALKTYLASLKGQPNSPAGASGGLL